MNRSFRGDVVYVLAFLHVRAAAVRIKHMLEAFFNSASFLQNLCITAKYLNQKRRLDGFYRKLTQRVSSGARDAAPYFQSYCVLCCYGRYRGHF